MTQIISRIFASPETATDAAERLKRADFPDSAITVIEPHSVANDELTAAMQRAGIAPSHAPAFAEAIGRGETLVSVRAPFGSALKATRILENYAPTETGLGDQGYDNPPPDPAAPFSSLCGWRVLSQDPTPLSTLLGLATLTRGRARPKPGRDLIDNPAPLSKLISQPTLTEEPAPLSKRVKMRVLWDNPAPLSTRLNLPALSKEQRIPDKRAGASLLSDNPAPLSSALGLKLLSNDPAPFSRLLGWRVLRD